MKIIEIWKPLRTIAFALILSFIATSAWADCPIMCTQGSCDGSCSGCSWCNSSEKSQNSSEKKQSEFVQSLQEHTNQQNKSIDKYNEGLATGDMNKMAEATRELAGQAIEGTAWENSSINCSMSKIKKQYLDKSSTNYCWYCNITSTMTNAYLSAVAECTGVVQTLALLILRYGFLIWLAYYILQQVSSLKPTSLGEILQDVLVMGFKVLLAGLAVRQGIPLLTEYFLDPVMLLGIDYGQEMLDGISAANIGSTGGGA